MFENILGECVLVIYVFNKDYEILQLYSMYCLIV